MAHQKGHFSWRGMDINGIDKLFEAAMKCSTREEAESLLNAAVEAGTPRDIVLKNLGYVCGYYSQEAMDKINALFGAEHPLFGKTFPTPAKAFQMGVDFMKKKMGRK